MGKGGWRMRDREWQGRIGERRGGRIMRWKTEERGRAEERREGERRKDQMEED